ncbi:hypothetical protein LTR86_006294 [Recurvomyces mirabilis]|nr:hypothetical protein LTR86_006294 [Recurvomyces mirabilis]
MPGKNKLGSQEQGTSAILVDDMPPNIDHNTEMAEAADGYSSVLAMRPMKRPRNAEIMIDEQRHLGGSEGVRPKSKVWEGAGKL